MSFSFPSEHRAPAAGGAIDFVWGAIGGGFQVLTVSSASFSSVSGRPVWQVTRAVVGPELVSGKFADAAKAMRARRNAVAN